MNVSGKYLKDESGNIISPITSTSTVYIESNNDITLSDTLFNSGWCNLRPNYPIIGYYTGSTASYDIADCTLKARRIGNIVEINGTYSPHQTLTCDAETQYNLTYPKLPQLFYPDRLVESLQVSGVRCVYNLRVHNNGYLNVWRNRNENGWVNWTANGWYPVHVVYTTTQPIITYSQTQCETEVWDYYTTTIDFTADVYAYTEAKDETTKEYIISIRDSSTTAEIQTYKINYITKSISVYE